MQRTTGKVVEDGVEGRAGTQDKGFIYGTLSRASFYNRANPRYKTGRPGAKAWTEPEIVQGILKP